MSDEFDLYSGSVSGGGFSQTPEGKQNLKQSAKQVQHQEQVAKAKLISKHHIYNQALEHSVPELVEVMDDFLRVMGLNTERRFTAMIDDWNEHNPEESQVYESPDSYRDSSDLSEMIYEQIEELTHEDQTVNKEIINVILANLHNIDLGGRK